MKNWNYIEGAKTGNKNQDWDVGNIDWDVGNFNGQWYVTKNGQKLVGPFMSMKEAERYLDGHKWELQNKYGNSKTGNDTPWEYAHRKPKVINDDKTGAEEFFKKLSDDVKEREEKDDADIEKVGNANLETSVEKGKLGLWNWYVHKDGTIVSGGTSSTEANAKEMARKALEKEKVGNFKTGTSALKPGDKVMSFGRKGTVKEVIGENTDNIYGEPLIKVEFEDGTTKTIGEHYMRKVGNARYTTREDVISHLDTDLYDICKKVPAGSPSFAYVSELQKKGWDISTISKYTKEIGKIIDQYKVGNSKTGNSTWYEPRRMPFQPKALRYAYEQAKKKGLSGQKLEAEMLRIAKTTPYEAAATESEMRKDVSEWVLHNGKPEDFVNNKRTGNEASDDKFAYVMREFDEGKLKTPDGKVVTDPAQAKAIAYSESKKTENGLARARKAMNAWNSERKIEPVGKYKEFIRDLKNAIMLDVSAVTYNNVDEQTLKSWVEQAKKEGFGSAIKGVQGKKVILDVY